MPGIDLSQFKALFSQTALDYTKKLEISIAHLKQNASDKEAVNEMYIASHSLKSQSLIMGYPSMGEAALTLEKTYKSLKDSTDPISVEVIEAIEVVVHAIKASLNQVIQGKGENDLTTVIAGFHKRIEIGGSE